MKTWICKLSFCALLLPLPLTLSSCNVAQRATEAAIEVIKERSPKLVEAAAGAAKNYWEENSARLLAMLLDSLKTAWEANRGDLAATLKGFWDSSKTQLVSEAKALIAANKDEILGLVKETAEATKDMAVGEAMAYVDKKLADKREDTLQKLLAAGYSKAEMDTDGNGTVSDDELAAFMERNPLTWWHAGLAGAAFYVLWQLRQRMAPKPAPVPAPPASPPSQA